MIIPVYQNCMIISSNMYFVNNYIDLFLSKYFTTDLFEIHKIYTDTGRHIADLHILYNEQDKNYLYFEFETISYKIRDIVKSGILIVKIISHNKAKVNLKPL